MDEYLESLSSKYINHCNLKTRYYSPDKFILPLDDAKPFEDYYTSIENDLREEKDFFESIQTKTYSIDPTFIYSSHTYYSRKVSLESDEKFVSLRLKITGQIDYNKIYGTILCLILNINSKNTKNHSLHYQTFLLNYALENEINNYEWHQFDNCLELELYNFSKLNLCVDGLSVSFSGNFSDISFEIIASYKKCSARNNLIKYDNFDLSSFRKLRSSKPYKNFVEYFTNEETTKYFSNNSTHSFYLNFCCPTVFFTVWFENNSIPSNFTLEFDKKVKLIFTENDWVEIYIGKKKCYILPFDEQFKSEEFIKNFLLNEYEEDEYNTINLSRIDILKLSVKFEYHAPVESVKLTSYYLNFSINNLNETFW